MELRIAWPLRSPLRSRCVYKRGREAHTHTHGRNKKKEECERGSVKRESKGGRRKKAWECVQITQ